MNAILAYLSVKPVMPPKGHPCVRHHVMEDGTDEEETKELTKLSSWSKLDPDTRARCNQRARERRRERMAAKRGAENDA